MLLGIQKHHPWVKDNREIGLEVDAFQFSSLIGLAGAIMFCNLSDQGFVGVADLSDGSNDELRGKVKLRLDGIVSQWMQGIGREGLVLKGDLRQGVTGALIRLSGLPEQAIRVFVGEEFEFENQLHTHLLPDTLTKRKVCWRNRYERKEKGSGCLLRSARMPFLPRLKSGISWHVLMRDLQAIREACREEADTRTPLALATVVKVEGSAYRRPGARMLIYPDGRRIGSVSGGCLEADVVLRAQQVLATGEPAYVLYEIGRAS